jgi:NADH:ubiquinone oxidoreductase subunit C
MLISNEYVKTEKLFNEFGIEKYQSLDNLHFIKIRPQELSKLIEFLKEDLDFIFLLDMTIDSLSVEGKEYDYHLIYLLLNLNSLQRVMIEVSFYNHERVPSLGRFYQNALNLECDLIRKMPIDFFYSDEHLLSIRFLR